VDGLLQERYGDEFSISLFDVGLYGVPIAIIGIAYMLLVSTWLLPGYRGETKSLINEDEDVLLGARVTQWSPAAGRTVQRSGLRDTGGIYLVSVVRAVTGHVHRAVSRDFVIQSEDICYFTGLVESFGDFCEKHGLEMLTNDTEADDSLQGKLLPASSLTKDEIGVTKESLAQADKAERLRAISRMQDLIHGDAPPTEDEEALLRPGREAKKLSRSSSPASLKASVVVAFEKNVIIMGATSRDRPGLISDITSALLELNLNIRHNEATVVGDQSISVWRCTTQNDRGEEELDEEELWSSVHAVLSDDTDAQSSKKGGIQVIRARVTVASGLINKSAQDLNFRQIFGAAIVAIQTKDGCITSNLSAVTFAAGDVLILRTYEGSALLERPPGGFYDAIKEPRKSTIKNVLNRVVGGASARNEGSDGRDSDAVSDVEGALVEKEIVWKDLQVLSKEIKDGNPGIVREFLTALEVKGGSSHIGKNVQQIGILKLPELTLVCIERPQLTGSGNKTGEKTSINLEDPLKEGDILWYAGPVGAMADLRKIPGLASSENEDIEKMKEHVHDRRLVQAVISRNSPLVGKTVKEARFRTLYGAAVIAIQRGSTRVMDLPSNVKLMSGDVLLLEAGPTFMASGGVQNNNVFSLLSEIEDSAPPRLRLLIPALLIAVAMLAVYIADLVSLLVSALAASIVMVAIGILSEQEMRESINWSLYVVIAAAFGIGTAMVNSGLATVFANQLVRIGTSLGIGDAGLLGAVYFATFLISNIVTNNAAAALVFPIAMNAADSTGTSRVLMSFTLMYGASASFMTPFGYQTNLLVFGPGKYKTKDFLWFGTPMQIVLWITSTAVMTAMPWFVSWIGSAVILVAVIIIRIVPVKQLFGGKSALVKK
jgi:di/tricarboxylate transporter/formyltetrahydrofolate hydrolase